MKNVRFRVWTPASAEVIAFKQVSPTIEDHTARAGQVSAQVREYDTAWLCEEGRRAKAADLARDEKHKAGQAATALGPLLRYRCERSERVRQAKGH